jgi:hypothetical protein
LPSQLYFSAACLQTAVLKALKVAAKVHNFALILRHNGLSAYRCALPALSRVAKL